MHFHIRKAELTDAKAIAQVHVKGWQQSYKDIIFMTTLQIFRMKSD